MLSEPTKQELYLAAKFAKSLEAKEWQVVAALHNRVFMADCAIICDSNIDPGRLIVLLDRAREQVELEIERKIMMLQLGREVTLVEARRSLIAKGHYDDGDFM